MPDVKRSVEFRLRNVIQAYIPGLVYKGNDWIRDLPAESILTPVSTCGQVFFFLHHILNPTVTLLQGFIDSHGHVSRSDLLSPTALLTDSDHLTL